MTRGGSRTIIFEGPAPEIICVLGSSIYQDEIEQTEENLTLAGAIVVRQVRILDLPPFGTRARQRMEERLAELQLRRIDLADRVVAVADGGLWDSDLDADVRKQVAYAQAHEVPVSWVHIAAVLPDDLSLPLLNEGPPMDGIL
jgi:hypothetical protein